MSSIIRFGGSVDRAPSAELCLGMVDWVNGSLSPVPGSTDFEDYYPFLGQDVGQTVEPSEVTIQTDEGGVINVFEAAGADETAGIQRNAYITPNAQRGFLFGTRLQQNADANTPQMFIGQTDTAVNAVWSSGALAVSSNQNMLGLRWNNDETFDIVANVDGTLTVLKDNIGVTVERTDGFTEIGMRVKQLTTTQYRLSPVINGVIARSGEITVANTAIPATTAMQFHVSSTVDTTTAVSFDVDWMLTHKK